MHRLISRSLVVLCIAVWAVALGAYFEGAYFTGIDGIPLRMKVTNIIDCPHCRGRFVSDDSGLHFRCLDCGVKGIAEFMANR
jgi:hypothetical protein